MSPDRIEAACEAMHEAYEYAVGRDPLTWQDVPETSKAAMRHAMTILLDWLDKEHAASGP